MMDTQTSEIRRLRVENETLIERVRQLEEQFLSPAPLPAHWPHLTVTEERFLRALAVFHLGTHEFLYSRLYGHLAKPPDPPIIKVLVTNLRKKLDPVGVVIETEWGRGYRLDEATRKLLKTENGDVRHG